MVPAKKNFLTLAPTQAAFLLIAWSRDLSQLAASFNLGVLLILALLAPPLLSLLIDTTNPAEPTTAHAVRITLQKLLAQLPLAFAVLTAALAAGSFNLFAIAREQASDIHRWLAFHDPFNLVAFALSFIVIHGTLKSRPAAEAPYRLAQSPAPRPYAPFANAPTFLFCALQVSLWLGAWYDPFGFINHLERLSHDGGIGPAVTHPPLAVLANVSGVLVFFAKALLLLVFQTSLERTLPRYRPDELFPLLHKILLPASIFIFIAGAAYLWLTEPLLELQTVVQIVLAIVGLLIPAVLWLAIASAHFSRIAAPPKP